MSRTYIKRECHLCVLGFPDKDQCERIGYLVHRFGIHVECMYLEPDPSWDYHTLEDYAHHMEWAISRHSCDLTDTEHTVRLMLSRADCCVVIGVGEVSDQAQKLAEDCKVPVRRVF